MKSLIKSTFAVTLIGGIVALGCSSSSNGDDGGDAAQLDASTDTGPTLFALSNGDSCFDIVSVATGSNDACGLGVADTVANMGLVGDALLVNYEAATGILTVGTAGALGVGPIAFNAGTLTISKDTTDPTMPTCGWRETDTSNVTVTAANEFDISAAEVENMFKAACTAPPTGGTCTSTWTWHMRIGTKTPPGCN
jgi:hypothetical protein